MRLKVLGIFVLILVIGIVALGSVSSLVYDCEYRDISLCTGAWSNIVMRLSGQSNAHGETAGSYTYALCCNYVGTTTCDGSNDIVRVSNTINAHGEAIDASPRVYLTDVCYKDLRCVKTTACGGDYPIDALALSANYNAHIGDPTYSNYKICCKNINEPPPTENCADSGGVEICFPPERCYPSSHAISPTTDTPPGECCDIACCTPATCASLGKDCGGQWNDGCGGLTVDCGTCSSGDCCNNGICQSEGPLCEDLEWECSQVIDTCGIPHPCGDCPPEAPECYPEGTCCTPDQDSDCASLNYFCGTPPNGCGGQLSCGSCPDGQRCDESFQCVLDDGECQLRSVRWNNPSQTVNHGEFVEIVVVSSGDCDGNMTNFVIEENDSSGGDDPLVNPFTDFVLLGGPGDNTRTINWTAEWQDDSEDDGNPPEFIIEAKRESETVTSKNSLLDWTHIFVLGDTPAPNCSDITFCEHYTDSTNCNIDFCKVGEYTVATLFKICGPGGCDIPGNLEDPEYWYSGCTCWWNETTGCGPTMEINSCPGDDGECGDGIIDDDEMCDPNTNAGGPPVFRPDYDCTDRDDCTGGNLNCYADCSINDTGCTGCNPTNDEYCGDGAANITGEDCDGNDLNGNSCESLGFSGGTLRCISAGEPNQCQFDLSGCNPPEGFKIGICRYDTGIINDCDKEPVGLLTSSWNGTWDWQTNVYASNASCISDTQNPCSSNCINEGGTWHCDPQYKQRDCESGGQATIQCPAEIQLPFFNKYNLILAVLVIAGIYAFIITKKR